MEKIKSRVLIILMFFIWILIIFMRSSFATYSGSTDADLADYAMQNPNGFIEDDYKLFKGKTVNLYVAPSVDKATIKRSTATCAYHRQSTIPGGVYKIVGVLDVNGDDLKVDGNAVSLNDSQRKNVADLSYAIYNAAHGQTGYSETTQKSALRYIFSTYIKGLLPSSCSSFFTNDINPGGRTVATEVMKYSYKAAEKDEENEPRIKKSGGQRYLGPFKVRFSGYEMDNLDVTVNGEKISVSDYYTHKDGKYTRHSGTNIPTSTSFYIKLDNGTETTSSWKVVLKSSEKEGKKSEKYKCRMLLLSHPTAGGQNLAIYTGKKISTPEKVEWSDKGDSTGEPEYGEIIIKKTDGFGTLSGAKFTIRDTNETAGKQYVIAEDGEFSRYGSYSQATKFVTDSSGVIRVTGLQKDHTYEVVERKAPDGYELSSQTKQARLLSSSELTFTYQNEPEGNYPGLKIKKVDKNTGDPIEGVGFSINLTYYCISQEGEPYSTTDAFTRYTNSNGTILEEMQLNFDVQYVECRVEEISVPSPYSLESQDSSSLVQNTVIYPNESKTLMFENEAYGKLKIIKKNQHGVAVSNAIFNIAYLDEYDSKRYITGVSDNKVSFEGGTPYQFRTDSSGIIDVDGLPLSGSEGSTYIVEEVNVLNDYVVDFHTQDKTEKVNKYSLGNQGNSTFVKNVVISPKSNGKLNIDKKDKDGNGIADVVFNIAYLDENYNKNYITSVSSTGVSFNGGIPYQFKTDTNGTIEVDRLPLSDSEVCTYLIEEINEPNNYIVDFQLEDEKEKIVEVSGETEILNIETGTARIKKIGDNNETLNDVQFVLSAPSGEYLRINGLDYANGKITIRQYEDIEFVGSRDEATVFVTNGTTVIENIPTGTYTFEELYNGNYGYKHNTDKKFEITVNRGNNEIVVQNEQILGNLEIHKVDERILKKWGTEVNLEGVEFKIRLTEVSSGDDSGNGNIYKYLQLVNSSGQKVEKVNALATISKLNIASNGEYHVEYVDRGSDATIFVTDENGKIVVNNLEVYRAKDEKYTYYIDEFSMGNKWEMYYNVKSMKESEEDGDFLQLEKNEGGRNSEKLIVNWQEYVDLMGYVWDDIPDDIGKVTVKPNGEWDKDTENRVDRDKLQAYPNGKGITVTLRQRGVLEALAVAETNNTGTYLFPSQMKDINSPIPQPESYEKGDFEQTDQGDKFDIVAVRNGGYKIEIDKLDQYYIEFEYNGLKYESTPFPDGDINQYWEKPNSSKATDKATDRNRLNNNFSSIKGGSDVDGGKTIGSNDNESAQLEYKSENNVSTLVQNTHHTKESLEGSVTAKNSDGNAAVVASTDESGYRIPFKIDRDRVRKRVYNINLGMRLRPQADMSIQSDLDNIKLTINGYSHTYNYSKRNDYMKDLDKALEDRKNNAITSQEVLDNLMSGFSVSAKNSNTDKYKNLSYVREILPSYLAHADTLHDNIEDVNMLKIYVTYRIKVSNESSLKNKVKLRNYYDPMYIAPGETNDVICEVKVGDNKTNAWSVNNQIAKHANTGKEAKMYDMTDESIIVDPFSSVMVYLTYQVKPKDDKENYYQYLRENAEGITTATNTTEILSYTTYNGNDRYASIDQDSAPDNTKYGDSSTYGDDVDSAPDLIIKRDDDYKKILRGTVFEDDITTTGTTKEENGNIIDDLLKDKNTDESKIVPREYIGDGKLTNDNGRGNNVRVRLLDQNENIVTLYHLNIDTGRAETEEAERVNTPDVGMYPQKNLDDGQYEFVDLVPGIYYVEYTYGTGDDEETRRETVIQRPDDKNTAVRTQDFKSTIIVDENPSKEAIDDQYISSDDKTYVWKTYTSDEEKADYKNKETSKGYWYEDEKIRFYSSAIDDYNHRNNINDALEHNRFEITNAYDRELLDESIYIMKSRTPSLCIAIEDKDDKPSAPRKKKKQNEQDPNEISVYDGNKDASSSGDDRITSEYDISFGIVERPRQRFDVTKEISYVTITLANGQILLEGDPHNSDISKYLTYPEPGRLKIEIDNEIIEGAKLNVTYDISVANYSDFNYDTFRYYMFGENKTNPVKAKIRWIDYLDKEMALVDDTWKIFETHRITGEGYLESNTTANNNNYNYIISDGQNGNDTLLKTAPDYTELKIGAEERSDVEIGPGEIGIKTMKASKLLATAKEMSYDNKVEFLGVYNSVGRFYYANDANNKEGIIRYGVPGNNTFNITTDINDPDNNSREPLRAEIDIVPPTGQTRIYYAIGISCLVLLVGGIILIKKKVLD